MDQDIEFGTDLDEGIDQGGQDDSGGQDSPPARAGVGNEDIEQLKASVAKMAQDQASWLREREDYKAQLAEERKRVRALAGGEIPEDPQKKLMEQARNEEIKRRLLEVMPELKDTLERQNQPNLGDKVYIQNAQREAMEIAKSAGFTSPVQQEAWCTLGDLIIHQTPAWKERFYVQGDMRVLKEVEAFMREQIIDPFAKSIEAKTIARIRKSGMGALPDVGSGGSTSAGPRPTPKVKVDVNNPEARQGVYANIMRRAIQSAGE